MTYWKEFRLSDFIDINPKVSLKSSNKYSFVEMKDLNESQKYVLPNQERELKGGARFENGDTLFARITPCLENGKICQVKGLKDNVGFGSTEFLVFRGKKGISNTDFVYYLSRYDVVRKFAEQNMVGTSGRQRIAKDAFDNISLELPDFDTQTAIADILSSLDAKIELNNQINKNLEALAQALFKQWFVDFEFPNENGQPYKSSGGEMVESDLGEIPKRWKIGTLNEMLKVKYGKDHKQLSVGKIPVYGSGGIMRYADQALYDEHYILIPRKGTLSNLFYVSEPFWSVDTMFYTIIKETYYRKYLFYTIKSFNLAEMNVGSAVPSMTTKVLNELKVIIPSDVVLNNFEKAISSIFEHSDELQRENQNLEQLRDTLLPKLISGELEVSESLIETSI